MAAPECKSFRDLLHYFQSTTQAARENSKYRKQIALFHFECDFPGSNEPLDNEKLHLTGIDLLHLLL
jgi:hypothetical protein